MLKNAEVESLLRLASALPRGSEERKTILAGLRKDYLSFRAKLASFEKRLPPEKKDYDRLNDIQKKSIRNGEIDKAKVIQLSRMMANSIDDWAKAERRGSAALMVREFEAADIFFARADQLRGGASQEVPSIKVPRVKAPVETPVVSPAANYNNRREKIHVLSVGSVNLRNGDNRTFNILDTWGGDPFHLTICDRGPLFAATGDRGPRRILIMGSGHSGWHPGQILEMWGDQTRKYMDELVVVKSIEGEMNQDLLERTRRALGSNSALAYVLK